MLKNTNTIANGLYHSNRCMVIDVVWEVHEWSDLIWTVGVGRGIQLSLLHVNSPSMNNYPTRNPPYSYFYLLGQNVYFSNLLHTVKSELFPSKHNWTKSLKSFWYKFSYNCQCNNSYQMGQMEHQVRNIKIWTVRVGLRNQLSLPVLWTSESVYNVITHSSCLLVVQKWYIMRATGATWSWVFSVMILNNILNKYGAAWRLVGFLWWEPIDYSMQKRNSGMEGPQPNSPLFIFFVLVLWLWRSWHPLRFLDCWLLMNTMSFLYVQEALHM